MKKKSILLLLTGVFLLCAFSFQDATKEQCRQFLMRTNKALVAAHNALKKSNVFKGNYVLAVRHQQYAKKMYIRRQYQRAVYHSRRARMLALSAIRDNSGKIPPEASVTVDEHRVLGASFPPDRELDDAIANDGQYKLKDEDLLNKELDLTLP